MRTQYRLFVLVCGMIPACAAVEQSAPRVMPVIHADDTLQRPEGYRRWMFVGASLGMGYNEDANPDRVERYHNIYIQPWAYDAYVEEGIFPDGAMLVMEILDPAFRESINRQGSFEGDFFGVEVAVKSAAHFADGWAYFNFLESPGVPKERAAAIESTRCFTCHQENGAVDNVFVQFYPALRDARALPQQRAAGELSSVLHH